MSHPALSSEEISELGQVLFEQKIRTTLPLSSQGKFLVLDVETGEYEIDRNDLAALKRLRSKRPGARLFVLRIGYPSAYRLGLSAVAGACRW
jgi:hypothetical protein